MPSPASLKQAPPAQHNIQLLFSLAGAACLLRTNSAQLAATIERRTLRLQDASTCELHVEVAGANHSPPATPHFRGMHHIVVASFGAANVFVFDLHRRIITAKVSIPTASDSDFWHNTLLPIAAGVCGACIGILPVHAACLARNGDGLLIAGESGAGKSTLSVALAQQGFDFVSDDWTYCTQSAQRVTAHGMAARIKLLPDAVDHFPALHSQALGISMNGELAFEVAADRISDASIRMHCRPRMLLFLRRAGSPTARFVRLSEADARRYLTGNVERLPAELADAVAARTRLIDAVAALPCWRIECGGLPHSIAREVERLYALQHRRWSL